MKPEKNIFFRGPKNSNNFYGFLKKIIKIPQLIVNSILLSFVYFIGVGISFIIYKVTGKKLFDLKKKKTYWKHYSKDKDEYRMY